MTVMFVPNVSFVIFNLSKESEINQLSADYSEKNSELQDLEEQASIMEKHLNAAAKLIDGRYIFIIV